MADYNEIKALLLDDRSFRRALLRQLQQDLKNGTLVQDPDDALMIVQKPKGQIPYAEAAAMVKGADHYVRKAVYRGHCEGGDGMVDRAGFIAFVLAHGNVARRQALMEWLEREEMRKHQMAVVA